MAAYEKLDACSGKPVLSPPYEGGEIARGQLDEQTRKGLEQYSRSMEAFSATDKEDKKFSDEERARRDRAKKANKIYRQACSDAGLESCFFDNFGVWSDYVAGRLSDDEFHLQAELRARQMAIET